VLDHRAALWDIAGGAAALLEAGGVLTSPAGAPVFPLDVAAYRGEAIPFVAGNPVAHAEAVRACRGAARAADRPGPEEVTA
jgi:fructose-1,6-bisphosphatase/inositol monophosphatase family enzyme